MRRAPVYILSASLFALAAGHAPAATATSGYFVSALGSSKVTRHRTLLVSSAQKTTVVDQVEFAPVPESFAWVLPVPASATIDLSSDALFNNLDVVTETVIAPPPLVCPPSDCGTGGMGGAGGGGGGMPAEAVSARETVGPYNTAFLQPGDPQALKDWLATNGFAVDAGTSTLIDSLAIVQGYGFFALKVVPPVGVTVTRPIRVTLQGSVPTLPMRFSRAGAPMALPTRLYVVASARADTQNMPSVTVSLDNLLWNWDTGTSNYMSLRQDAFNVVGGKGWVVEYAAPFPVNTFKSDMLALATSQPAASGWGQDVAEASSGCMADLDAIFGGLDPNATWVTRFEGNLAPDGLMTDLTVGASANQTAVPSTIVVKDGATEGTPPACPEPCGTGGMGGMGGLGGMGGMGGLGGMGGMGGLGGMGSSSGGTGGMPSGNGGSGGMGGSGANPGVCIPGEQVECACPGGSPGAQACNQNGTGYEACQCSALEENGGCGCEAAGAGTGSAGMALGFLAVVGGLFRRRRAGRS
ncbi:DUF2330 domain-containing protein [Polyangium sorediatum]|uniref:DUF2330 domain-containing protein n=1 Tax=Polyangium sorediatum TaxID=889274 RepID=A0ABT6NIU5_9BACT|nr:DUF2330 domain-containing protein [Polyangium sorediatum]MDI1428243.1 DUF2330 domain-containing protein [Polyangium sorediatum]